MIRFEYKICIRRYQAMKANENILKSITYETKSSIADLDVVTPTIYSGIFQKYASEHDADIEDDAKLTDELLSEKINIFTNIQNQTSQNAQKLSDTTDKAICAIKDKDETTLAEVLEETRNLKHEIEKLKESVYKDELTNVFNRKWLHDKFLDQGAQNFVKSGTLAIIDLNYFKIINDTYGHLIGDKVLIFIANQLKKTKEHVVRYGGDEFLVVFSHHSSAKSAFEKLNSIRETILKKQLKVKDASFKVSFSLGVHQFSIGDSLSNILEEADKNMYADKIKIKKHITGI